MADSTSTQPADAAIDTQKQLDYWNSVDASNNGMLGGFQIVHRTDIQNSKNFLAKLKLARPETTPYRIADCGAGIGRITKNFLSKINTNVVVDIVEPVKKFTDEITEGEEFAEERASGKLGQVFNVGLENWTPEEGAYWIIWTQWCAGHLTDGQLVDYLKRCSKGLQAGGVLVVKENLSTDEKDMYDELDSSVTRTDKKFRQLFKDAGLKLIATELAKGMPKSILPVRSYALRLY